jgi:hypothetical protein
LLTILETITKGEVLMLLKPIPLEIPEDDPFKNDALGRQEFINEISPFLCGVKPPFVMALNSPWGSGKTTLIQMWRQRLHKENHISIYFNAWETDFSSSPLISFVGEVTKSLKEVSGDDPNVTQALDRAKAITSSLVRHGVPAIAKIATFGALDLSEAVESALGDAIGDASSDLVESYLEGKRQIDEFHQALEQAFENAIANDKKTPIIIFVDELDRCKPSYAVELLENIKHLFNAQNAIFVLAIDRKQLDVSIKALYGDGINTSEYLRRFIDFELDLPAVNKKEFVWGVIRRFELEKFFQTRVHALKEETNHLIDMLVSCFDAFSLPPRAREHCITRIAITAAQVEPNQYLYPDLLAFLIVLKTANYESSEIYKNFMHGDLQASGVVKYLESFPKGQKFVNSREGAWIVGLLIGSKSYRNQKNPELEIYKAMLESPSIPEDAKDLASIVIRASEDTFENRKFCRLEFMARRIELVTSKVV